MAGDVVIFDVVVFNDRLAHRRSDESTEVFDLVAGEGNVLMYDVYHSRNYLARICAKEVPAGHPYKGAKLAREIHARPGQFTIIA